ncbi:hypothetical protein EZV62_004729 [Acer yangbiense]|uniref:NPH3 domain-containing protein n=1 Tax=Acer yangbiense TaxID=1000413 RepID=A0A5C7ILR1_9ROSI|nr:hypothetical protein EZV62_004729 [Acer yangbiense]
MPRKFRKKDWSPIGSSSLEDLLIPNMGYSVETLYDIDCVQRILDHFMLLNNNTIDSNCIVDEGQLVEVSHSLTPLTMVANLVDGYLAEVAPDVNLKLPKLHLIKQFGRQPGIASILLFQGSYDSNPQPILLAN